jgi:uncharacterized membrane protein
MVIDELIHVMTFVSALGCGLVAGVFFAFSTFVMKALTRLPPAQGIAAMQAINVAVLNRWFFAAFFGTTVGCLLLVVLSLLRWQSPGSTWRLIGCALYLIGTILVTIICNVPRNDALAALEAGSADGATRWAKYVPAWTAWNHVRTAAALAASVSLTIALCLPVKTPASAPHGVVTKGESSIRTNLEAAKPAPLSQKPEDWPLLFEQHRNAGDLDAVMTLSHRTPM